METKIYTVKVQSQREKSISERLKTEMERGQVEGNIFVPTERVYFARNGKKAYREKTMYPGYVFVETTNLSLLQDVLKLVPGNTGILKTRSGDVSFMKKEEINKIKFDSTKIEEEVDLYNFIIGETVQIIGGPFDKFRGTIEEINKEKGKVKLTVLIFGRATMVDLQLDQIEKILE